MGDHLVPVYVASYGRCDLCREELPALCQPGIIANKAGTLIESTTRLHKKGQHIFYHSGVTASIVFVVISQNALVKIDPNIPFEVAALFGCAEVNRVGLVVNTAKVGAGKSLAIVGMGGVNLNTNATI